MKSGVWHEISMDLFKELFDMYWNLDESTKDKILEIQNLDEIRKGENSIRLYLGFGINIYDFSKYNETTINILTNIRKIFSNEEPLGENSLSMCTLERFPLIVPFSKFQDYYYIVWTKILGGNKLNNSKFDEISFPAKMIENSNSLWFTKCDEKYLLGNSNDNDEISDTNKLIRVRCFYLDEWKEMINKYCEVQDDNILLMKDDVNRSLIISPSINP